MEKTRKLIGDQGFVFEYMVNNRYIVTIYLYKAKKKNMCVYGPPTDPNFWPDPKFFMAL